MNYNNIKKHFEENFPKKKISELSLDDKGSNLSLIISEKLSFDFDSIRDKKLKIIKTSDTLFFENEKIIFVEFKINKIGNIDIRLKTIESLISFLNYISEHKLCNNICFPNSLFEIYFVYNYGLTPTHINQLSQIEREISLEYKPFFCKLRLVDKDRFKKRFRL